MYLNEWLTDCNCSWRVWLWWRWWSISWTGTRVSCLLISLWLRSGSFIQRDSSHTGYGTDTSNRTLLNVTHLHHNVKRSYTFICVIFLLQLLGSLISDFVDSFRPTARINSICGEIQTLPWCILHWYCYISLSHTHARHHVSVKSLCSLCVCIRSL